MQIRGCDSQAYPSFKSHTPSNAPEGPREIIGMTSIRPKGAGFSNLKTMKSSACNQ